MALDILTMRDVARKFDLANRKIERNFVINPEPMTWYERARANKLTAKDMTGTVK